MKFAEDIYEANNRHLDESIAEGERADAAEAERDELRQQLAEVQEDRIKKDAILADWATKMVEAANWITRLANSCEQSNKERDEAKALLERIIGARSAARPRPDWTNVPNVFMFWAVDAIGNAYFYESRPVYHYPHTGKPDNCWHMGQGAAHYDRMVDLPLGHDWRLTCEERPDDK